LINGLRKNAVFCPLFAEVLSQGLKGWASLNRSQTGEEAVRFDRSIDLDRSMRVVRLV